MTALGPYGSLIAPTVIDLALIWLALRVARMIFHLVVVVLVIVLLVWGYTQYRHAAALQSAAQQLAAQVARGTGGSSASYGAAATSVLAHAQAVVAHLGLDPTAIRAAVSCAGGEAVLVLTDTQARGILGLLAGSQVRVPLSPAIHCSP